MTAARLIDASARSVTYIGAALALGIINASLQGYLFGNVFGWVWTVSAGPLLGLVIAGVIEILPAPTERPQLDIPRLVFWIAATLLTVSIAIRALSAF